MNFNLFLYTSVCLMLLLLTTPLCFASQNASAPTFLKKEIAHSEKDIRDKILTEFDRWKGVKYKFGGTSADGIDCSSLMQEIYHTAFAEKLKGQLPRTTAQQIKQGAHTAKSNLKPGDLIFFQMTRTGRHVGVYIGDKKFIHASTSQGVTVSTLDNAYWNKRFETARRILA